MLEAELKALPENFVVMAIVPFRNFEEVNFHLLDLLIKRYDSKGSYITINRPYKSMVQLLKNKNINFKNMFFIDCITKEMSERRSVKDCYFVGSPSNLTEIAIALDPVFKEGKHKFVFLDSLDTLAIYNPIDSVIKFAHFLTSKVRLHDISGIFLAVHENSDEKLMMELAQFCDKVIDLRGFPERPLHR
jgi:archaellum biogenesis ATPase FlaH